MDAPLVTSGVVTRFQEMENIIALTRHIAEVALDINEKLIAENVELKRELASRPPSRQGRRDH